MPSMLLVVASFCLAILSWGLYGPLLHVGQELMSTEPGYARLRPFICVGLAYFLIGVLAPLFVLATRGERGQWSARGVLMSLWAGALGALGALGIVMALSFGGKPSYVMPLVFGGAPVVNSFLTIYWAGRMKEIGPVFLAGLLMVVLGAVTVLTFKPASPPAAAEQVVAVDAGAESEAAEAVNSRTGGWTAFGFQLLSIAATVCCWGAYGPTLHSGQSAMQQSRMRPFLCVGLAYFGIAVIIPYLMLQGPWPEASSFSFWGTLWSLGAGAAGAIGALGIIMAFNFGGRPVYVMPLVFGGAPVVNTFATIVAKNRLADVPAWNLAGFFAGLMLVIAGAVMVLVFAPKGAAPKGAALKGAGPKRREETPEQPQAVSSEKAPPTDAATPTEGAAREAPPEPEAP